jgi:hypothetical protein
MAWHRSTSRGVVRRGQYDDRHLPQCLVSLDLAQDLHAADLRHVDAQDEKVGPVDRSVFAGAALKQKIEHLLSVVEFYDGCPAAGVSQAFFDEPSMARVVVRDQGYDLFGTRHKRGTGYFRRYLPGSHRLWGVYPIDGSRLDLWG